MALLSEHTDIYRNGIYRIADFYKLEFEAKGKNGFDYLKTLASFQSTTGVLVELYFIMIKEGKCMPIEMLGTEEKTALWEESRRLSKIRDKKHLINVCRALHAFGTYISLND